jgi:hypothetical protein
MAGEIQALVWAKSGENSWCVTAPGGAMVVYDGPRFALVDPGPSASINQRFSVNIDLSFVHRLTLSRSGGAQGVLSREAWGDRLAKRLRFAVERQSGDQDFDDRVYAAFGQADAVQALIAQADARRLVLDLFDLGVTRIEMGRERVRLSVGYVPSPAMGGGQALSAIASRLDALVDLWPRDEMPGEGAFRLPWRIDGASLALAWAGGWGALILAVGWLGGGHDAKQIETFGRVDWIGLALLLAIAVIPSALLAARRADAHRVLGTVLLGALLVLPFSQRLRIVEVNRLASRAERAVPAEIVEVTPLEAVGDPGALVMVADRLIAWPLSEAQAALGREGRLCATGVAVEGLRGLRYVADLRVWSCQPTKRATELGPDR